MSVEDKLPELIKAVNEVCKDLDGPVKAALLRTAAAYFENISAGEMQLKIFQESIKKVL